MISSCCSSPQCKNIFTIKTFATVCALTLLCLGIIGLCKGNFLPLAASISLTSLGGVIGIALIAKRGTKSTNFKYDEHIYIGEDRTGMDLVIRVGIRDRLQRGLDWCTVEEQWSKGEYIYYFMDTVYRVNDVIDGKCYSMRKILKETVDKAFNEGKKILFLRPSSLADHEIGGEMILIHYLHISGLSIELIKKEIPKMIGREYPKKLALPNIDGSKELEWFLPELENERNEYNK